jgi:ferredoxin-NADP reductase
VKVDGESVLVRKRPSKSEQPDQERLSYSSAEYNLVLLEKQKYDGTDAMSFKFSEEDQGGNSEPKNKRNFNYAAGQFAFFDIGGVYNDPKGPIRHFTLASSPTEEFIMVSTRIRESPYKKRFASLEEGTKVKVKGPQGKFTLHDDYSKSAIFLSGGIGVTPFRSMIKYSTDKNLPIKIIMFDSNKNLQNILFKNVFDDCVNRNKNLTIIYTITEEEQNRSTPTDWKGEIGRIDRAMLMKHLRADELEKSIFYICGPPAMIKAMQDLLQQEIQIPKERIKVEEFTGY